MPRPLPPDNFPTRIEPQLLTAVTKPPRGGEWRYEVKFDGYRMLARIGQDITLFTRNGFDWTARMPRLKSELERIHACAWLDGEVVIQDAAGRPAFEAVQNAFQTGSTDALIYYVFDIMYLGDRDLRAETLDTRRAVLSKLMDTHDFDRIRYSGEIDAEPGALLEHACEMRLEGIVGKKAASRYSSGRTGDWIKLKCNNRQEFIIAGYTRGAAGMGSLIIGQYAEGGELLYAGRVKTGFDDRTAKRLMPQLKSLVSASPTIIPVPANLSKLEVIWIRPELVCEVKFTEITPSGKVRHGVFVAMREDRLARTVTRQDESAAGRDTVRSKK